MIARDRHVRFVGRMDWPSRYQRDRQSGFSSDLVIRPALEDGLPIRRERVGESDANADGPIHPTNVPGARREGCLPVIATSASLVGWIGQVAISVTGREDFPATW